jgi:hypothetical protein
MDDQIRAGILLAGPFRAEIIYSRANQTMANFLQEQSELSLFKAGTIITNLTSSNDSQS